MIFFNNHKDVAVSVIADRIEVIGIYEGSSKSELLIVPLNDLPIATDCVPLTDDEWRTYHKRIALKKLKE